MNVLEPPPRDPAALFDLFRGGCASDLLVAALAHFEVFEALARGPMPEETLRAKTGLAPRAFLVLLTALRAMGLVSRDGQGLLELSPAAADHLVAGRPFDLGGYMAQDSLDPGVLHLVERLRTNRPQSETAAGPGVAYIFRQGLDSAMERPESARELTWRLAGRARNVAPALAAAVDLSGAGTLLDVGAGSGLFSAALLAAHPGLRAILLERPEVLKVAGDLAAAAGVGDRVTLQEGDMFGGDWPCADVVLLSNVLHDWDAPECRKLVASAAAALPSGGRLLVHDAFLDDDLGGPLSVALYSIALFRLTEGRAYSAGEVAEWMLEAGLEPGRKAPTLASCSVFEARKP